jgi:drug/metabolite transporter (DMT)-like permease
MKTYAILTLAILAQATGNVFLSKGMKQIASASPVGNSDLLALFPRAIESPTLWCGTALLIISFLLFATALSWADLSFVLPTISVEVILTVALADHFLNEPVSPVRWMGTLLISIGVILVAKSGKQTGEAGCEKEKILKGPGR